MMSNYLAHYGVLGQKWGVRRYQNKDGTLTKEGKNKSKKDGKKWHLIYKPKNKKEAVKETISQGIEEFSIDLIASTLTKKILNKPLDIKEQVIQAGKSAIIFMGIDAITYSTTGNLIRLNRS